MELTIKIILTLWALCIPIAFITGEAVLVLVALGVPLIGVAVAFIVDMWNEI